MEIKLLKLNLLDSKKYFIFFILIFLAFSLINFEAVNFQHPKMEIISFFIISIISIFLIIYFQSNNDDKNLYKTAFLIILLFGLFFSFINPICYGPDEVEHFIRADITSRMELNPEYDNGSFQTIQSAVDLIKVKSAIGYDGFEYTSKNATIFNTDADTKPINHTLTDYPNAFAQNPFYGYLAPAIGMIIAKLFNLNAIWLLWFSRIFNVFLYAGFSAIAIKKTPILKMPMLIFACLPLAIYLGATASIDPFINGLGLILVAYFFHMYKSPKTTLTKRNIIIFTSLVILIGLAKLTCFTFILLLLLIPKTNFKNEKYYYYSFISIILTIIIAVLWTKFYVNPGFSESWRGTKSIINNFNSTKQLDYILHHKKETIFELLKLPLYFPHTLLYSENYENFTDVLRIIFIGFITFFYPKKPENIKTRIGTLIVFLIFFIGTYMALILSWTTVGDLSLYYKGAQIRYFYPMLTLLPFIFRINIKKITNLKMDNWIITTVLLFLAFRCMLYVTLSY